MRFMVSMRLSIPLEESETDVIYIIVITDNKMQLNCNIKEGKISNK